MFLMQTIRSFPVEKGAVAVWWFGQNGFIFKSAEGTLCSVDLYLTDSCASLYDNFDLRRRVPILIEPEDLDVDVFACTHNHQDHTDPETIRHLRNKDTMRFVGPHPSCETFAREGVESGRITPAWPDCFIEHNDVQIHGTFALPTDTTDLNHMGFVLQFGSGPKIYITGDTDYSDLLVGVTKHKPDAVITCINGGFNNLSHWEAADLVGKVGPKVAVPCHYDMFADNSIDPRQFRSAMQLRAKDVAYHELKHGDPWIFA
jgi:L-ascorbate 6-phosphate lactonase